MGGTFVRICRDNAAAGPLDGDDFVPELRFDAGRVSVGCQDQLGGNDVAPFCLHEIPSVGAFLHSQDRCIRLEVHAAGNKLLEDSRHKLVGPELACRVGETHRRVLDLGDYSCCLAILDLDIVLAGNIRIGEHACIVRGGLADREWMQVNVASPGEHKVAVDVLLLYELLHGTHVLVFKVDNLCSTLLAVLVSESVVCIIEIGFQMSSVTGSGSAANIPGLQNENRGRISCAIIE